MRGAAVGVELEAGRDLRLKALAAVVVAGDFHIDAAGAALLVLVLDTSVGVVDFTGLIGGKVHLFGGFDLGEKGGIVAVFDS